MGRTGRDALNAGGKPLLKWAGGKRQLLPHLRRFHPHAFTRYLEPPFGSGAVFFDLHAAGRLQNRDVVLIDSNADLIGVLRRAVCAGQPCGELQAPDSQTS